MKKCELNMANTHCGDNSNRILVGKSEERNPFWRLKNVYEDTTKRHT
jgi:hypothetical protein